MRNRTFVVDLGDRAKGVSPVVLSAENRSKRERTVLA